MSSKSSRHNKRRKTKKTGGQQGKGMQMPIQTFVVCNTCGHATHKRDTPAQSLAPQVAVTQAASVQSQTQPVPQLPTMQDVQGWGKQIALRFIRFRFRWKWIFLLLGVISVLFIVFEVEYLKHLAYAILIEHVLHKFGVHCVDTENAGM